MEIEDRFWAKVEVEANTGCWHWAAYLSDGGYGIFAFNGRAGGAHRFAYEHFVGPIPEGLTIDHLCRVRECVNPDHLEPVTQSENARRGDHRNKGDANRRKTHCPQGHPYDRGNTRHAVQAGGHKERRCVTCIRDRSRKYYYKNREKILKQRKEEYAAKRAHGKEKPSNIDQEWIKKTW